MKLKAIHMFLILLFALLLCSCLGESNMEGMANSRSRSDVAKAVVKDSVKDAAKNDVRSSGASGGLVSRISGIVSGADKAPPQATISGSSYSDDSNNPDLSDDTAMSSTSSPASYPAAPAYPAQPPAYPAQPPAYQQPSGSLGIPRSQIASGSEDLYILKSEVIPPVCPACPSMSSCPRQEPCSPCPPCARCPEPSFECKKVPNYSSNDDSYLPRPVLADFSQFGA